MHNTSDNVLSFLKSHVMQQPRSRKMRDPGNEVGDARSILTKT